MKGTALVAAIDDLQLTLVESWEDAERFRSWLGERRSFLAIDVETTGLNAAPDPWMSGKGDKIRLCQFGDSKRGFAFDYRDWRWLIKDSIESYREPTVCHNLLYDTKLLRADGITIPQLGANDTMVMSHLRNSNMRMDLKGLAKIYIDRRAALGQTLLQQAFAIGGWTWATIPVHVPAYWQYSTLDTCLTSLLAEHLYSDTMLCYREAYELELAVIHCLREAELAGMAVDEDYRRRAGRLLQEEIQALKPQIPVENPGSDDQIRDYLISIGAPLFVTTDSGALSVDKEVLKWLEPNYPVALPIRLYREKTRQLHNYIDKMAEQGTNEVGLAAGGVLRASTRPLGAKTGRMSVTQPPLQTLPRGRVVRDAIVARPGYCFVLSDFSGMEMRALAADAPEPQMLAAFNRGDDLHNFVATAVYGPEFTKQQRTTAKNAGFAKVYGAGVEKFAVTAGIPVPAAAAFLAKYDQMFPEVNAYLARNTWAIRNTAQNGIGYIDLIDGRRIYCEANAAYKATNYRIQGSCAIVTKRKIVELDAAGLGPYFRLAVHDELIYELPLDLAAAGRQAIDNVMPDKHSFPGVVLTAESDICNRWGDHYADDFPIYVPTETASWITALKAA